MTLPSPLPQKTRLDLEWDRVLNALAVRCSGPMGASLARSLPFADEPDAVRRLAREAQQAFELLAQGEPLPVIELPDVREAVGRLRVGGVLAPSELRAVAQVLLSARSLRRFLGSRKTTCPDLFASCATDASLDRLADEVSGCFEADGTLADRASSRLRELRGEYQTSRQRMLSRLDDLMNRFSTVLQERYVTEREGRYVVPVRSDSHERFPGIVHSTSASGSTLFVEPRAVIPMGNRIKMLEADVEREETAVYTRLSALLSDSLPSVEACTDAMAIADVRAATARLAQEFELAFPEILDEPRIELLHARHLLLVLELPTVIPSDLVVAAGHALVVTGPNAGGKTVALKSLGLAALLVRAGLPVPCAPGSRVGIFEAVLTDVGDDQSLQKNLSSFSAHISNLSQILLETGPGALVLLDEVAGGTDPREGEALAAGVLDSLCARGGAVAVTTHYEGLKALALADERFENASVGFDLATMEPTFVLTRGIPGSSSALAVARRYGMPSTVLERAERFLSREDRNFESLVRRLHDERSALELARAAADEREREARALRVRLEGELEVAKAREKQRLSREGEELMERLRRARDDLRVAQGKLKKPTAERLVEAERLVNRVAADVAVGGALESAVLGRDEVVREPVRELRRGMRVWVPRLRAEAEVIERVSEQMVRVAAGALKLVVAESDLRSAAPVEAVVSRPRERAERGPLEVPMQTTDNTCDLRGMRADDAVSLATTFLDRSLNVGRRVAFFVHGHGTGALREAIRKEFGESPYIASFRPGQTGEGGDGVTIAWLA
ncbi:MAG: Smr/MutS family protein [Myxococcales bacterium]